MRATPTHGHTLQRGRQLLRPRCSKLKQAAVTDPASGAEHWMGAQRLPRRCATDRADTSGCKTCMVRAANG